MKRYELTGRKYLAPDERDRLEALLKRHRDERDAILIELALATGARASELLAIRVTDMNIYQKSVFIEGIKDSNDRTIPLRPDLYIRLERLAKKAQGPLIFDIGYSRLRQIWLEYRPVEKGFHCLRHSFAIELFKRTRDLQLVKIALGHRSITNTMIYSTYVYESSELMRILA